MFCPFCGTALERKPSFCPECGRSLECLSHIEDGETTGIINGPSENHLIEGYFNKGYPYEVILDFLKIHHGITMCLRTLKNRLKHLHLSKRSNYSCMHVLRAAIQRELRGPGRLFGYRTMFNLLKQKYLLRVRRRSVMKLISEMNPAGSLSRRRRRFCRRSYHSLGPNYVWHVDGYDKLKPYGFAISGCIDGFSRKILWLTCGPTNNNPAVIASLYVKCVSDLGIVPMRLRTDCGTENGIMAAMQCTLRAQHTDLFSGARSHNYGTSVTNQRIESWWAHFRKQRSQFWLELLEDLKEYGHFNGSHEHKCLLRFAFLAVLQKDLNEAKMLWNQHRMRPSRMSSCPSGIPNELFSLPHRFQARDCGYVLNRNCLRDLSPYCEETSMCGDLAIQEYLTLVKQQNNLQTPHTWESAFDLYLKLKEIADL